MNTHITILNNKRCKIVCHEELAKRIKNLLSYTQKGIEWTPAYQNGWSGITYLINKKGEFSLGLLEKVTAYLMAISDPYTIEDLRKPVEKTDEILLTHRLEKLGKVPRDYQIEIVNACLQNRKGIVRACTGSGKSICMAIVTAKLNRPTNIYVPSLDLLQQFHSLFSEIFDESIGFIGNGRCDIERINIVSIWSVSKAIGNKETISQEDDDFEEDDNPSNYPRIVKMLQLTKVHLIDECHGARTTTIRSIFDVIDPEYIYGFSGTPYRFDGCDLLSTSILGPQIIDIPASRLIAEGWLAQPIIKFIRVPKLKGMSGANYQTIYKSYVVENNVRNKIIIENAKELLNKGYQVLILFKQLSHGRILSDMLKEEKIKHEYLSGADNLEERIRVKEKLANKETNLILTSKIFDQGVDLPTLSGLILAGSGKSNVACTQRIGRVIRSYPGKNVCCIVDMFDDVKFLKNHSKARYEVYKSEEGFKIFTPNLKKELQ